MYISLKPGLRIKIRDLKTGSVVEATVLSLHDEKNIVQVLLPSFPLLKFSPGDRVEFEFPQREDALYIFQTYVLEVSHKECVLQRLGEPKRMQRRKSLRIPANRKAEYLLRTKKKGKKDFYEGLILDISGHGALLAVKEPLSLGSELFLLFKITLPGNKIVPTGMGGKIVREHISLAKNNGEWGYSYGIEFDKPFSALTG